MRPADIHVAQQVNLLPWETWLSAEDVACHTALPHDQVTKVLRAGRRKGSITVLRTETGHLYKRVGRHPLPGQCPATAPVMGISCPSLERP